MLGLITKQQTLVNEILAHSNKIDSILDHESIIIVPDVKHENKHIREKLMQLFELEQKIVLDMIYKGKVEHE